MEYEESNSQTLTDSPDSQFSSPPAKKTKLSTPKLFVKQEESDVDLNRLEQQKRIELMTAETKYYNISTQLLELDLANRLKNEEDTF